MQHYPTMHCILSKAFKNPERFTQGPRILHAEKGRIMNKRRAKQEACSFVADLIQSTLDVNPFTDETDEDMERINKALEEIAEEMTRRAGKARQQ